MAPIASRGVDVEHRISELLRPHAASLKTRRRQQLPLIFRNSETVYVVCSGLLALNASLPGRRRLVLGLIYPGDVFRAAFAPALANLALVTVSASNVLRLRGRQIEEMLQTEPELAQVLCDQLSKQQARIALRVATIGFLTSEGRVSAFLIELALRLGWSTFEGIAFDIPLTRADIAAYLALNPDTISRQISRLKEIGILQQWGRGRVIIRDWAALKRECEIAEALQKLYGRDPAEAS